MKMKDIEVNIRSQFFRVGDFVNAWGKPEDALFNRLEINDNRLEKPAYFIDSILRKIPTQDIYLDGRVRQWLTIDGNKRLNAIKDFYDNKFPLATDIFNLKVEGIFYKDLTNYLPNWFLAFEIRASIITSVDKESAIEIIKRIQSK